MQCCTFSEQAASGVYCPVTCPHGARCIRALPSGASLLEQALKNQVGAAHEKLVRNAPSEFLIVDAQSVKNADSAGVKGYDAGTRGSDIKRHVAVDTQGLPHALAVTTANVSGCTTLREHRHLAQKLSHSSSLPPALAALGAGVGAAACGAAKLAAGLLGAGALAALGLFSTGAVRTGLPTGALLAL